VTNTAASEPREVTVNHGRPTGSDTEQEAFANGDHLSGRGTAPTLSPPPQSMDPVAPAFIPPQEVNPSGLVYKIERSGAGNHYQACKASPRVGNIPLSILIDMGASATVISQRG
jgi:hypothetical protein